MIYMCVYGGLVARYMEGVVHVRFQSHQIAFSADQSIKAAVLWSTSGHDIARLVSRMCSSQHFHTEICHAHVW